MTSKKGHKSTRSARTRVRRGNVQDAQQLRAELLEAAMKLFSEAGLESVSMREVAARTGVSAMTPYRYFANKSDLLTGLWQFVMRSVCDRMAAAIKARDNPQDRLKASLESFLDYYEANPDHYRLLYMTEQTTQEQQDAGPTSAPVYAELLGIVRGVLEEFARAIGADTTYIKLAADMRAAMQLGYLHGTLINRRYPWSERSILRAAYIERTIASIEHCLLRGPGQSRGSGTRPVGAGWAEGASSLTGACREGVVRG